MHVTDDDTSPDMGAESDDLVAAMVGAVGGTIAEYHVPMSGAVVSVGLEYLARHVMPELMAETKARQVRRAGRMLTATAECIGAESAHELAAYVVGEERADLTVEALQAASTARTDSKIRALGMALGDGLAGDDTRLDETFMIVRALRDMETPHVRVLAHIGRDAAPSSKDLWEVVVWNSPKVTREELARTFPGYMTGLSGILAVLSSHGLIEPKPQDIGSQLQQKQGLSGVGITGRTNYTGVHTETRWRLAPLGLALLDYIASAADDADNDVPVERENER